MHALNETAVGHAIGPEDNASPPPTFLVGAERSGTTLLRLMLDHHPRIAWCSEFEYAVERMNDGPDDAWPDIRRYHAYLATHRIFRAHGFRVDATLDYPALIRSFLEQKQHTSGNKPIIGATVHKHFDRLLRIWPDARFIHLLRDGRDVARSSIGMGWAGNIWCATEEWIQAQQLWARLRRKLPSDRFIEVRYERLVQEPHAQLGRICRFLKVPFDERMFDYADRSTYGQPDASLAEQWRHKMSPRQVQFAESQLGDWLARLDYPLSGLPSLRISPMQRAWLRLHNRIARARFRMERYGFRLFAADLITRRLNLQSLQGRIRLALNDIDTTHLRAVMPLGTAALAALAMPGSDDSLAAAVALALFLPLNSDSAPRSTALRDE